MTKEHAIAIGPAHISTYPILPKGGALLSYPEPKEDDKANTGSQWHDMPKGWTSDSRDKYAASMAKENQEGPVATCMDKIGSHVSDPGAFCASLHDRVTGTTHWRKGGKKKEDGYVG